MIPINNIFYDGIILDLDGVVTNTVKHHIKAWKESLDSFLRYYHHSKNSNFIPLDTIKDYKQYIDGKPRYKGVQSFLYSRNITLPFGKSSDSPGFETICAIGNLKNRIYLDLVKQEGAYVYDDALEMIKHWRREKLKTVVVSASKNCRQILSSVGIIDLFDNIFDGNDAEVYNLNGKPQPDIFLQAARLSNISEKRAVIIEDSFSGVEAGKKGQFSLIIGISRNEPDFSLLYQKGADIVVSKLTDLIKEKSISYSALSLPSGLVFFEQIFSSINQHRSIIFFDYDGTLTPIVPRPELAIIGESTREMVSRLSEKATVAIISGRELSEVKKLSKFPHVYYAGNHGLELEDFNGKLITVLDKKHYVPFLDNIQRSLQKYHKVDPGLILERKTFSIAVHYRLIKDDNLVYSIEELLRGIVNEFPQFKLISGKRVFELRPSFDWDKGKAVQFIINEVYGNNPGSYPIYLGDDLTDEDAFRAVKGWGAGILVGSEERMSNADFLLRNTDEVYEFIARLEKYLQ